MKGTRSLFCTLLVGALAALLGLGGCTSNDSSAANTTAGNTTGQVRIKVAKPKNTTIVSPITIDKIDLLQQWTGGNAGSGYNPGGSLPGMGNVGGIGNIGDLSGGVMQQYFVPVIHDAVAINFPSTGDYADLGMMEIPSGIYDKLQLVFDESCGDVLQEANLPFDPHTLTGVVPIIGGMRVNPGDTITLLVDLASGQGSILQGGGW